MKPATTNIENPHNDPCPPQETMPTAAEAMECRRALVRAHVPPPDVDAEWASFARQHGLTGHPVPPNATRRHTRRNLWIGFAAGIAASVLLFVCFGHYLLPPAPAPIQVFAHSYEADEVFLTTDTGENLYLNQTDDAQALARQGVKANADSLNYSHSTTRTDKWLTLTTPRGKDYHVTLPDDTRVWLNADSRLSFPERFTGPQRLVRLVGEGYFEVAPDPSHPFTVETKYFLTTALGTEFNLRSYSATDAHVVLVNGKVALSTREHPEPHLLSPGQKAQWDDNSFAISTIDTYRFTQWKEGYFYFDNVPLSDILQELGRWYNMDVILRNPAQLHTRLHFVADRNEGLAATLEHLSQLRVVSATVKGRQIIAE